MHVVVDFPLKRLSVAQPLGKSRETLRGSYPVRRYLTVNRDHIEGCPGYNELSLQKHNTCGFIMTFTAIVKKGNLLLRHIIFNFEFEQRQI